MAIHTLFIPCLLAWKAIEGHVAKHTTALHRDSRAE